MKKNITILAIAMVAGMAQADVVIYEETFTNVTFKTDDLAYYPADFAAGTWVRPGAATVTLNSERLQIETGADEAARGTSVVVDSGDMIGAGTYTLTFDLNVLRVASALDVEIWEIAGGSGLGTRVDTQNTKIDENKWLTNTGVATRLTENVYVDGEEGSKSIDFTYSGANNIALLFSLETGTSTTDQRAIFDNVQITTTIPEPATVGMLGLGALLTLFVRRIKHC